MLRDAPRWLPGPVCRVSVAGLGLLALAIVLGGGCQTGGVRSIAVRDFGALPDDDRDDAAAIQAALDHAQRNDVGQVRFEAGIYDFSGLEGWDADQGRTLAEKGATGGVCYLTVRDAARLELVGAVDGDGRPLTKWIKRNDLRECQPLLLAVEGGSAVTVRNVVVDMAPYYSSAGRVLLVQDDDVEIEVLPGHPRVDGQRAFIMGTYDFATRLARVVRLTWDSDLPRWRTVGAGRCMRITHRGLAQACRPGDGVFWFQGNWCGPLLCFRHIETLLLENVRILGGHGFTLTCGSCRDVTYRNVRLAPEGNRIATSCRDGFKIFRAGGRVVMDSVVIDGCLGDDGQNIHGTWLVAGEKRSPTSLVATAAGARARARQGPVTPGSTVRLLSREFVPLWEAEVESCRALDESRLLITFRKPLPDAIEPDAVLEPQEWLPREVIVRNCTYRNTGRFGIYLKAANVLIEDSLFEGNAGGIRIGGEWSPENGWLESTHPWNVTLRRCTFRNNRLEMRFGDYRLETAVAIEAAGSGGIPGLVRDVRIHDNTFEDEGTCLSARNCDGVWFWNNRVRNCGREMAVDPATTRNVFATEPPE